MWYKELAQKVNEDSSSQVQVVVDLMYQLIREETHTNASIYTSSILKEVIAHEWSGTRPDESTPSTTPHADDQSTKAIARHDHGYAGYLTS